MLQNSHTSNFNNKKFPGGDIPGHLLKRVEWDGGRGKRNGVASCCRGRDGRPWLTMTSFYLRQLLRHLVLQARCSSVTSQTDNHPLSRTELLLGIGMFFFFRRLHFNSAFVYIKNPATWLRSFMLISRSLYLRKPTQLLRGFVCCRPMFAHRKLQSPAVWGPSAVFEKTSATTQKRSHDFWILKNLKTH